MIKIVPTEFPVQIFVRCRYSHGCDRRHEIFKPMCYDSEIFRGIVLILEYRPYIAKLTKDGLELENHLLSSLARYLERHRRCEMDVEMEFKAVTLIQDV